MRKLRDHRLPVLFTAAALLLIAQGCAKNNVQDGSPPPKDLVSARHILIMYEGSKDAPVRVTRTKEEAKTFIEGLLARLQKGEKFEDLAVEYSDCSSAKNGGRSWTLWARPDGAGLRRGRLCLRGGRDDGIVETPFGYHIIQRYK